MSVDHERKREFERYSTSLKAEVTSMDDLTTGDSEKVVLKDISGGGTRFITTRPEHYSVGDKVDITIQLPGGGSLKANVKGSGKVAWMGELEEGEISIGLCMDDLLAFDALGGGSE